MSLSIYSSKIRAYSVRVFLFFLFLFLFDRGLFFLIKKAEAAFYDESGFEMKFSRYVKNKKFSTLILGTSRTYAGIHPRYMSEKLGRKAFREAQYGKGPEYNYYFYQMYKKHAGVPKAVIYGIDYFIFSSKSNKRWLSRFGNVYGEVDFFFHISLLVKYKPRIDDFLNNILTQLQEEAQGRQSKGNFIKAQKFIGIDPKKNNLITKKPARFKKHQYRKFPGKEGRYLKKLLDELAQDKVTVILVSLPDYYGTFVSHGQRRVFNREIRKLARKYKNTHFLNYNRLDTFPLKRMDYFRDGGYGKMNSHLSKKGGKVFNDMFLEDIKKFY
ncbi:MAG: hypothetical protein KAW12_08605 [Candidatus Aminicenantes bacterium]|nr:hypothetical protein [Candidatus Aminicenantes bacterium]